MTNTDISGHYLKHAFRNKNYFLYQKNLPQKLIRNCTAEKIRMFKTWLLYLFYYWTNAETPEWVNHSWTKMGIILNKVYNNNIFFNNYFVLLQ